MQVYDRRKRLKRVMHLLEPILSVSFLNNTGDIVAALNRKLVVIRAESYKFLTADEMSMLVTEHAKSVQQPLRQTPTMVLRAGMQLARSGSSKHLQLAQQQHLSQVGKSVPVRLCMPCVQLQAKIRLLSAEQSERSSNAQHVHRNLLLCNAICCMTCVI